MCHVKSKNDNFNLNQNFVDVDIDNLETEKQITFSSIFRDFKIVPLETSDKCLIGNISQIEIFNDTIYVLDSSIAKALFVFDNKGKFIRKIGTVGKGPGEYINPLSFTFDEKNSQIQILDRKKIIKFNNNGELIGEIILNKEDAPKYIACLDGVTYVDHQIFQSRESSHLLSSIDNSGNILNKWLPYQSYVKGFRQPLNTTNHLVKTTQNIKYVKPMLDTIYCIANNTINPYFVISSQNKLTASDIREMNNIKDVLKLMDYYWNCKKFLGARDYVENSNLIMFRYQNQGITHSLFYWPEYNKIECTKHPVIDDLTLTTGYRRFYSTYGKYFVSSVDNFGKKLENFIEDLKNNRIKLPEKELSDLKKLTLSSNPVLILYECRESMRSQDSLPD